MPRLVLLVLAALGLLSIAWSIDRAASLWGSILVVGGITYFEAGVVISRRGWVARFLLPGTAVLGLVVAALSLGGYTLGAYPWSLTMEGKQLAGGLFGYANAAAGLVFLLLPPTIGWGVTGQTRWGRLPVYLFTGVSAVCQIVLLVLTGSRLAPIVLLAPAVLWVFLVFRSRIGHLVRSRWWARLAALAMVVVIALGVWQASVYVADRWAHVHEETASADQHRLQVWHAAFEAGEETPWFGHGIDTFYAAYKNHRIPWTAPSRYAHDLLIQEWVELGVVGTLLLACFLVLVLLAPLRRRARGEPRSGDDSLQDMSWWWRAPEPWLWVGALAFILQNLVDITWYFPALLFVFMIFAGALANTRRPEPPR